MEQSREKVIPGATMRTQEEVGSQRDCTENIQSDGRWIVEGQKVAGLQRQACVEA
jgi:hypothetical protein